MRFSAPLLQCSFVFLVSIHGATTFAGEIQIGERTVSISGVGPSSRVAWIVLSDETRSYRRIIASAFDQRADLAGTSRIDLHEPISPHALWIAIDVESGAISAATASGGPVSIALDRFAPGQVRQLARDQEHVLLLLVRPGEGAWTRMAQDSGAADGDFQDDGKVTFSIDQLEPLAGSPESPQNVRSGDIVIAVDLRTLEVAGLKLGN